MPHECTNCGRTFPDGSKEMLSGCPDCGGNKFQFAPSGRVTTGSADSTPQRTADSAGDPDSDPTGETGSAESTGTVGRAAETVRGWVSSDSKQSGEGSSTDGTATHGTEAPAGTSQSDEPDRATGTAGNAADANRHDGSERSWPSSGETPETGSTTDSSVDTGEFTEWPDTARRPEDRSTAPEDGSDEAEREHTHSEPESVSGATEPESEPARTASESASPSEASSADDAPTDSSEPIVDRSSSDGENTAQADARSEVVSTDELPAGTDRHSSSSVAGEGEQPPEHGRVVSEPSGDQPSIEELRAELNEQFESIKIVSPGQYELNLMELYNREEYIISLQEDGRYVIDVPDSWHANDDP